MNPVETTLYERNSIMISTFQPVYTNTLFSGRVTVYGWGARSGNFSLTSEEGRTNIGKALEWARIRKAFCPKPAFNAELATVDDLTEEVVVGSKPFILGNGEHRARLMRGKDADVFKLPTGEAFWISSADCPTMVVLNKRTGGIAVAHTGKYCFLDPKKIMDKDGRKNFSVVDTIVNALNIKGGNKNDGQMMAQLCIGIRPPHFLNPWNKEDSEQDNENAAAAAYCSTNYGDGSLNENTELGQFVLGEIARMQFCFGYNIFPTDLISSDSTCTFSDVDQNGNHVWHSWQRAFNMTNNVDSSACKKRNGILVIRRW